MAAMKIKVSVILPSLNVADYIKECMDSVLNQSLRELEIICVDAGSTDGTREILDSYQREDFRVIVLHSDVKSYGRQINMGLDYASGEYVAILETDDWITQNMYECLYEYANRDKLDYAAADFDIFYQLQSGSYYFIRQKLFSGEGQDWYGKILESEQIATLRASDYVLWKGIYHKKFLDSYHIRLHETPKAAFQDMGFLQQVKTYAKKAKYIDKSFYRYRQGRAGASSGELSGLQYYKEEFFWLNENLKFNRILRGIHKKYYYFTMSISFLTKYEQILKRMEENWSNKRLSEPYAWFREELLDALKSGLLEESMYDSVTWERFMLLLTSQEAHAQLILDKEKREENCAKNFIELTKNRPIVIFGCGVRGEYLMLFCDRNHIHIDSFCDNNAALHGQKRFGFPVISPLDLKNNVYNKNEAIVLSMKNGQEQVYKQLLKMGIEADRIVCKIPEGII